MGDNNYQRKMIESEMDRFEKEISSLAPPGPNVAPPPPTSFIPAQLRRPTTHPHLAPPGTVPISAPPHRPTVSAPPKPSPIIISGAPQVYNAGVKASISKPPTKSNQVSSSTIVGGPQSALPFSKTATTTSTTPAPATVNNATVPPAGVSTTPTGSTGAAVTPAGTSATPVPGSSLVFDPSAKPSTSSSGASPEKKKKKKKKKLDEGEKKLKKVIRSAGGQVWEDPTLQDWDPSDFRLFCGDLGNDVTDEVLTRVFGRYPSFQKAKVVRDKRSNKTKGFGFVSFKDPNDFVRAIKELDGRYVGSRPIKLRKSNWRNRNLDQARKREKERSSLLALIKK